MSSTVAVPGDRFLLYNPELGYLRVDIGTRTLETSMDPNPFAVWTVHNVSHYGRYYSVTSNLSHMVLAVDETTKLRLKEQTPHIQPEFCFGFSYDPILTQVSSGRPAHIGRNEVWSVVFVDVSDGAYPESPPASSEYGPAASILAGAEVSAGAADLDSTNANAEPPTSPVADGGLVLTEPEQVRESCTSAVPSDSAEVAAAPQLETVTPLATAAMAAQGGSTVIAQPSLSTAASPAVASAAPMVAPEVRPQSTDASVGPDVVAIGVRGSTDVSVGPDTSLSAAAADQTDKESAATKCSGQPCPNACRCAPHPYSWHPAMFGHHSALPAGAGHMWHPPAYPPMWYPPFTHQMMWPGATMPMPPPMPVGTEARAAGSHCHVSREGSGPRPGDADAVASPEPPTHAANIVLPLAGIKLIRDGDMIRGEIEFTVEELQRLMKRSG